MCRPAPYVVRLLNPVRGGLFLARARRQTMSNPARGDLCVDPHHTSSASLTPLGVAWFPFAGLIKSLHLPHRPSLFLHADARLHSPVELVESRSLPSPSASNHQPNLALHHQLSKELGRLKKTVKTVCAYPRSKSGVGTHSVTIRLYDEQFQLMQDRQKERNLTRCTFFRVMCDLEKRHPRVIAEVDRRINERDKQQPPQPQPQPPPSSP